MRFRLALVVVLFTVVHLVVLPDLAVGGLRGDALVALAVAGGLVGGPERGATLGFVAGLIADLFIHTPFGLTALVLAVVGFGIGMLQTAIIRSAWWIPVAIAFVAGVASVVLWALVGAMVGQAHLVNLRLIPVALVVGAFAALLAPLALRLLRWSWGAGPTARLA